MRREAGAGLPFSIPQLRVPLSRKIGLVALTIAGCVACGSRGSRQTAATYTDPQNCQPCHAEIATTYQQVAMARSLYRPSAAPVIEDYDRNNHFYHSASDR